MILFSWIAWSFTVVVLSWIIGWATMELGLPIKYAHLEDHFIAILIRGFLFLLLIVAVLKVFN